MNEALTSKGAQFGLEYDVNRFTFNGAQAGVAFAGCLADVFEPSVGTVNTALACNDGRTGAPLVLWTFTFDVPIDASSGTSVFSLENLVSSDDRNPHTIPSTVVDAQVRVARTTDLSVTRTDSPDPVVAGTPMTYTLIVANVGPEDVFGVVVTDEFPAEVTFDSATQGCLYDVPSHSVTCTVGNLASGASTAAIIDVTVLAGTTGSITNTATDTSLDIDTDDANDTVSEDTTVVAPPTLTGTATVLVDEEGDGISTTVNIGLTLSSAIGLPIDVHFNTSDVTAPDSDSDYVPVIDGLVTIPAASTDGTIQVLVLGDARWENDKSFGVTITNATIQDTRVSPNIVNPNTTVTIRNDEDPPTISIQETQSINEGGSGETTRSAGD